MSKAGKVVFLAVCFILSLSAMAKADMHYKGTSYDSDAKQNGIAYVSWWQGQYSQPDADASLENLAAAGANWISLLVTGYQEDISSTSILTTMERTPTDDDLVHVIGVAHDLGLKVMLKPHLDLNNDPTHWRGQIGQKFTTEAPWDAWFASYQDFIFPYAELAETYGADQFCAGTELVGTTHRADDWRAVIDGIRVRYGGPIVYASNHSGEETGITWWDAVDYIGVDAYYPLTGQNDPTGDELKTAWTRNVTTLAHLAATWEKSILFTEIGYRSQDGANRHPWDYSIEGTIDLQEQADAYQAVFESVYEQPWFAGIYWWSWGTNPLEGGPLDDGYTPYDKPAEDILRAWYGAPPRDKPSELEPDPSRIMEIYTDALAVGWEDWSWGAASDLAAADQAHSGTQAISVSLESWGALSLHVDPAVHPDQYYWLEFYVLGSSEGETHLWAFLHTEDGSELAKRTVDAPDYMENGTIEAGIWKRVLIPLSDLDPEGVSFSRISFQDRSGDGSPTFWMDDIRLVEPTGVDEKEPLWGAMPTTPILHPNYPNPFNIYTEIPYDIPAGIGEVEVTLNVYNIRGQLVRRLFSGTVAGGHHRAVWDGRNDAGQLVSSGVYVYSLRCEGFISSHRMALIK